MSYYKYKNFKNNESSTKYKEEKHDIFAIPKTLKLAPKKLIYDSKNINYGNLFEKSDKPSFLHKLINQENKSSDLNVNPSKIKRQHANSNADLPTNNNSYVHYEENDYNVVNEKNLVNIRKIKESNECYDSNDEVNSISSVNTGINSTLCRTPTKKEDFKKKYKTELCKYWQINKICKFGENCAFAHGYSDVKIKSQCNSSNYKTKKCKQFFKNGYCPYGKRCQFRHINESINIFSYNKTLRLINDIDIQISPTLNRSRLCIFQEIVKTNEDNVGNYFQDALNIKKDNLKDEEVDFTNLLNRPRFSSY